MNCVKKNKYFLYLLNKKDISIVNTGKKRMGVLIISYRFPRTLNLYVNVGSL